MDIIKEFNIYEDMIVDRLAELQIEVCTKVIDAYRDTSKSIVSVLQYSGEVKKSLESLLLRERHLTYEKLLTDTGFDVNITFLNKYKDINTETYLNGIHIRANEQFISMNMTKTVN